MFFGVPLLEFTRRKLADLSKQSEWTSKGRVVEYGVRKIVKDRQQALSDLVHAIKEYRKLSEAPLRLRGADHAKAVQELNNVIERVDRLLQ
jgi:hypothetical protein